MTHEMEPASEGENVKRGCCQNYFVSSLANLGRNSYAKSVLEKIKSYGLCRMKGQKLYDTLLMSKYCTNHDQLQHFPRGANNFGR